MSDQIEIELSKDVIKTHPGDTVVETFVIANRSEVNDQFIVAVEGLDSSWYELETSSAKIYPMDRLKCRLTLNPPKDSTALAETHSFSVKVAAKNDPRIETSVPMTLVLRPFYNFELKLDPPVFGGPTGNYDLLIHNAGNDDVPFRMVGIDSNDSCRFTFTPNAPNRTCRRDAEGKSCGPAGRSPKLWRNKAV
ncbi:MAG: hypothetical protein FJ319_12280 [SAR202 cluster bacterium]|nr:hypothetical protein [SAR202 cluster bacterium]